MMCLIIALSLLGVRSYRSMGLEAMPEVDMPFATVVAVYPGATPVEIETDIAKRIEDAAAAVDGIKHITTSCMDNVALLLLEFNLGTDIDVAANETREKIDAIINEFPSGAEKPKVLKYDINAQPVVNLALTGNAPLDALYDYADNQLRDRLSIIPGVASVDIVGGAKREVEVLLDRNALAARGLTSLDVAKAIQDGVRTIPAGRVHDAITEESVKFDADYATPEEIAGLEVAGSGGARCRISDLGRTVMGTEELRRAAFIDSRPAISIKLIKRPGANIVQVVDRVREALGKLQATMPGGMELVWASDNAAFIRASVRDTQNNIYQGIMLTGMILFFFLYNIRTTLIAAVTMPLTILISLFFMQQMGYTLNVVTLMSTGLSVGILITNSIVVLESIIKRFNESGNAREAAIVGSNEVFIAVLASAGTNLIVLFPIAFMGSLIGLFFSKFAWTMIIMTAVSLFISFTLTPLLASIFLKQPKPGKRSLLAWVGAGWDRGFDAFTVVYGATLRFFEKRRWAAVIFLAANIAIFIASLGIASKVGFDFFPKPDNAELMVKMEFPTGYSLPHTLERVKEAEQRIKDLPELKHYVTNAGKISSVSPAHASEGVYLAQFMLLFSEKDQRTISMRELSEKTRKAMEGFADCMVTVREVSGVGGELPIELSVAGDDLKTLDEIAVRVEKLARDIPGIVEPESTVRTGKPEVRVRPRRAVLSDLGIPPTVLGMGLRANFEGLTVGTFKTAGRNYDIVVKLDAESGKDQVGQLQMPGAPGRPLALSGLADIEDSRAPVQINRSDKQRVAKVFAGANGPLDRVVGDLRKKIDVQKVLPPGYRYFFSGDIEIMAEANAAMADAGIIAILLTFLVLAAILESFRQPVIIMITLPLGLIGVLWALAVTGLPINMFVMLGAVMLIGIVVNNAILIIDQLNQLVESGVPRHEAMVRAATDRFRPIVMITAAAILGMWPLATATGIGSEFQDSIGVSSIGGIAVSALLTLFVIPILYDLFTRRKPKETVPPK